MFKSGLRPCPVCDALERKVMYRQHFIEGPLGPGYDVSVCKRCGAGFADGIREQSEIDSYYATQSKYAFASSGGSESPWDFERFEMVVDQVDSHLNSQDIRILDLGCATGGLLSVFRRHGYANLLGIDPSPKCAEAAKELHDVEVRACSIGQMIASPERFDLVLMVGVLEHIRELKEAVNVSAALLEPGGVLYCAVPDVEGMAQCPNAPYQQFSVEHVNFFSSASLKRSMTECNMGLVCGWRSIVEWRSGILEPITSGLFSPDSARELLFDSTTEPALQSYINESAKGDERIASVIASISQSGEAFLIWGAGTLARRLLATSRLMEANIAAFIDSSPLLQGRHLAGKPILAPSEIAHRNETIVICSGPFESEILAIIRNELGLKNRVISLWNH